MQAPRWTLGDVVRKARQEKRWTQKALAQRAQVNTISVVRLERASDRADRRTIERVAQALDATVAELYAITEETALLAALTSEERRHLMEYAKRVLAKHQPPEDHAPIASPPGDLPASTGESHEPIRRRRQR
jgi:transcriptional regulator with XRE-family HTH domain